MLSNAELGKNYEISGYNDGKGGQIQYSSSTNTY